MTLKVAINGFGRIGRLALRAAIENGYISSGDIEFVAINDLGPVEINALLFQNDSVHGPHLQHVTHGDDWIDVGTGKIKMTAEADPSKLPWKELGVDLVMECTGRFTNKEAASAHIEAGARRVLVSAPCSDADSTIVYGVNEGDLKANHTVISNASCTTNCLAPVAKVLNDSIGIEKGFMTTVHAYTGDQNLHDGLHKDPRRARAAMGSMIPTTTGAARAVGLVLPELAGKLDGTSIRVPTPNVSMVDLTFTSKRDTSEEEVNQLLSGAASNEMKRILQAINLPLVSIDMNHNPASSIADLSGTKVIEGNLVRIMSWYDNEWGFANRMCDTATCIAALDQKSQDKAA
ncbi:type I glyceraldehyde-3-phosphate dehydrogenase [Curvivirga aplysinae]|uniref:type I glyceraldehyde-3-phosphate dehydrogenase n=1 Tax=Curvivirga aplysinae TaxID=2529852 RepID=UPI0012BCF7E7|nr:type I glyceraldehyde-3-phosphate dehydrogenase [Curvivirga aplysinae]MTI09396.1 type I glyceraldehyde-3-phosphate dehydrogenase [Curvivirga aplysinae]